MNSYFEIGGQVIACVIDQPDVSHHGQNATQRKTDRLLLKTARDATITLIDDAVGDTYDVKTGLKGAATTRQGLRSVGRGLAIAGTLAAMDGPLPFGDVLAAGFLIGGGAYMTYSGIKDVVQ